MRISFGGGPRRSRNGRRYHGPSISFELGPVGSCIASVFIILTGIFVCLISLGNILGMIIGIIFIAVGVLCFVQNKRKISNNSEEE